MMLAPLRAGLGVAGVLVGLQALAPQPDDVREVAAWLARPAVLPFAWRAVDEAQRRGDPNEVFARAQLLLQWLPTWTDGHTVFAYRYALDADRTLAEPAARAAAARQRLDIALAYLEGCRRSAGRREVGLLQAMSMLPLVAEGQEPGLAAALRERGGPAAVADHYLAAAEALAGSPVVREQRLFFAPILAAGLLDAGRTAAARAVLATALQRAAEIREPDLATEWRARLAEALQRLDGDPTVDLSALAADERFHPLLPHLR